MMLRKILYLGNNKERFVAYYKYDLLEKLKEIFNVKCYGPYYKGYNKNLSIIEVLDKLEFNPDIIIISNTWEIDDPNIKQFDPNPNLKLKSTNIPKLFFLNKEYKKLDLKLDFIRHNNIEYVTSVLKDQCQEWELMTNAKFIWKPFGINLKHLNENRKIIKNRKYDFGFTGNLHTKWTMERQKVKEILSLK